MRAAEAGFFGEKKRLKSILALSLRGIAKSLFATLFPSNCRICGAPLVGISRLPVCNPCLQAMRPVAGAVCDICGERRAEIFALWQLQGSR